MRGEDLVTDQAIIDRAGSPPHARGRLPVVLCGWGAGGITPACAGKTTSAESSIWADADHPRMRGEDVRQIQWGGKQNGSPPHARGRHLRVEGEAG